MKSYLERHPFLQGIREVTELFDSADVVDPKSIEASMSLREFIHGALSYRPWIEVFLFKLRDLFAKLLGLPLSGVPERILLSADEIPMTPGEKLLFTVRSAEEDRYWIAGEVDVHLSVDVAIVAEPMTDTHSRFHVITFVRFHRPVGRFYFSIIEPFHHLLVRLSMRAAVAKERKPRERNKT